MLLASALALLLAAPRPGAEPPRTFEELRERLPELVGGSAPGQEADEARAKALAAFAKEPRAALSDRLLAVDAWRRTLAKDDPAVVDAYLLEAHLRAVGQTPSQRKKALRSARSALLELATLEKAAVLGTSGKKAGGTKKRVKRAAVVDAGPPTDVEQRLAHVDGVLAGDQDLERLLQLIERRRAGGAGAPPPRSPPTAREAQVVALVEEALVHYEALGDERVHADARLALALFHSETDKARDEIDRALSGLVRVGGIGRDVAPVREAVRRARARVLFELGRYEEAAHESLVADRAAPVPHHLPAFEKPPPNPYGRSRATSELCATVRAHGISCSVLEKERMGEHSFYDFSQERLPSFDEERARRALEEYQPLLTACIEKAAKESRALDGVHLEIEWSIGLDGRVGEHSLLPRRLRESPLDRCLGEAFARFRYPRYRGEMQHTQLAFDVGG